MSANNEIDMTNFEIISTNALGFIQELKDKNTNIHIKKEKKNSPYSIVNPTFDKIKEHICNESEIFIGPNLTFINGVHNSKTNKYGCFNIYGNNQSTSTKTVEIVINGLLTKNKIGYKKIIIEKTLFSEQGYHINDPYLYDLLKLISKEKLEELKSYFIKTDTAFVLDVYINKDFERTYKLFNGDNENDFIEIA